MRADDVPPVDLPVPVSDDPYAQSPLRYAVGPRLNPLASEWYEHHRDTIVTPAAPVITAHHPQLAAWAQSLDGLDADWQIQQAPVSEMPLTRVIPRLVGGPGFPEFPIPAGTYWIDYVKMTQSVTKWPSAGWVSEIRERLPEGSSLILGAIGPYKTRAALWQRRYELFGRDFISQFDHVVVPDISSYVNDPHPHAFVAERMTQRFAEIAADAGVGVIPILSWQNEPALLRQLDRLGALVEIGAVNTIYIELLSRGDGRDVWLKNRIEEMGDHLAHLPVRIIFSGLDAGWAISMMLERFDPERVHLTSLWPWMRAALRPGLSADKARRFRAQCLTLESWLDRTATPKGPIQFDLDELEQARRADSDGDR